MEQLKRVIREFFDRNFVSILEEKAAKHVKMRNTIIGYPEISMKVLTAFQAHSAKSASTLETEREK